MLIADVVSKRWSTVVAGGGGAANDQRCEATDGTINVPCPAPARERYSRLQVAVVEARTGRDPEGSWRFQVCRDL